MAEEKPRFIYRDKGKIDIIQGEKGDTLRKALERAGKKIEKNEEIFRRGKGAIDPDKEDIYTPPGPLDEYEVRKKTSTGPSGKAGKDSGLPTYTVVPKVGGGSK